MSKRSAGFRWCAVIAAVLISWTAANPALSQVIVKSDSDQDDVANVFLPAPRGLRQHLIRAQKDRDEERYADAVLELGALLTNRDWEAAEGRPEAQDYFLNDSSGVGTRTSLKAEAQRVLGELPAKGLELYELQFGADARALLREAIASGSLQQLNDVTRRYFHTVAGYEAAMLLGRHHLDHGQPLAAALSFKRVAETRAAQKYEPELSLLLATCWLYSKRPEKARETLETLKRNHPAATLRMGRDVVGLYPQGTDPAAWIESLVGGRKRVASDLTQWAVYRGSATRNARAVGSMPLLNFRWRVPTANDPSDETLVQKRSKEYVSKGMAAVPSLHPLAVGDLILMRTPRRLVAVDFSSGKRIWEFPWFEIQDQEQFQQDRTRQAAGASSARLNELNQRIWEDAVYGQMSSDGQSVFAIYELGFARTNAYMSPFIVAQGGQRMNNPGWPRSFNQLAALNVQKEGKLRWIVGGEKGEDEPRLAGAFFLGPPLPLMGKLYVMAEVNGEIRLVVLNGRDGKLEWQQQLAHVDTRTILTDPERRLAGAVPSFADGVLLCPTSAGAVVAVDASNRSLLWGYQYRKVNGNSKSTGFGSVYNQKLRPVGQRWADASATLAEGSAVLTPVEGEELVCLDLLTGQPRWPAQPREDGLYVACVHDSKIIVVGKDSVRAIRLADGKPGWDKPLALKEEMPSGRGFYTDHHYFLPTTGSRLLKIDLDSGEIAAATDTQQVLGNLICHGKEIISQGGDWLSTFYQSEPLRQMVADRLKDNGEDAWALARHGELLLQDGKRREALQALRSAYRLDGKDDSTRLLLVNTLLAALGEDFEGNRQVAAEVDALIVQPAQRAAYLRLMAAGFQSRGEAGAAFESYLELAALRAPQEDALGVAAGEPVMDEITRTHLVRRERWVQGRLAELLDSAPAPERARMDTVIQERFDRAATSNSPHQWREFIGFFHHHPLADRARMRLADRLAELDELLEAELVVRPLVGHADRELAGFATALQADLFRRAEHWEAARATYRQLQEQFADVVCRQGKTGSEIVTEVRADTETAKRLADSGPWPDGMARIDEEGAAVTSGYASYPRIYPVLLEEASGALPEGTAIAYDQRQHALVISSALGDESLRIPLGDAQRFYSSNYAVTRANACGHLLVVSLGYEIIALDVLQAATNSAEAILWRTNLAESLPGQVRTAQQIRPRGISSPWGDTRYEATDRSGKLVGDLGPLGNSGFCYQKERELICVQPMTGDVIWSRGDIDEGCHLFGDGERIFVVAPNSLDATVLSMVDGSELGKRPVARNDKRWVTLGSRELRWNQEGTRLQLELHDLWEKQPVWKQDFPYGSKGALVHTDELAILQPDGAFRILDLSSGEAKLEQSLLAQPQLTGIYVFRSSDQYHLITNGPSRSVTRYSVSTVPLGPHVPMVSGLVYAFDRASGESLWPAPAMIDRFGLPLNQGSEVPVLAFLRHVNKRASDAPKNVTVTEVVCLDKRDGRVVMEQADIPVQTQHYQLRAKQEQNEVELTVASKTFRIKFSDDPRPPEPPARTGALAPPLNPLLTAPAKVGSFAGALFKALGPGKVQAAAGLPLAPQKADPAEPAPPKAAQPVKKAQPADEDEKASDPDE